MAIQRDICDRKILNVEIDIRLEWRNYVNRYLQKGEFGLTYLDSLDYYYYSSWGIYDQKLVVILSGNLIRGINLWWRLWVQQKADGQMLSWLVLNYSSYIANFKIFKLNFSLIIGMMKNTFWRALQSTNSLIFRLNKKFLNFIFWENLRSIYSLLIYFKFEWWENKNFLRLTAL